ncbi:cohesin domain-containing protein, partial [candidate division KSB1 bacterium]|nr:cohesin domain-containing protein [candidate division KSB1 bacterium]
MNLIHIRKCWFIGLAFGLLLMQSNFTAAQISIGVSDLPAQIGTYYLTEDDTLTDLPVTVGAPGANQTWRIEQTYPRVLTGHQLLAPGSAPYHSNFPNSNLVLYFRGRMGNWLHSYYLDDMSGDIYMFQSLTSNGYQLQGMGIDSSKIVHQEFMMDYKGAIDLQPDLMMHPLPLNYGQYWKTVSQFTIEIDTTILGIEATVRFTVKDSLENWVDGWGTLILPYAQYPSLRIKTYATVFEKVYINDTEFRNRKMRSIHYTWIAKNFGTVARVISHSDQSDPNLNDNFTRAKQISRLRWFNPQITFNLASGSGAPGAVFDLPITISDVTDLKIQAIQFHLSANPQVLQPLEFRKTGTLSENWNIVTFTPTDSGLTLKIGGTEPLLSQGTLGIVRYRVNPNAAPNAMTPLVLRKLEVKERGPILTATAGQFEVKQSGVPRLSLTPAELNFGVDKNQLTFQIQNSGTGTLTWQVAENPEVSWITSLSPGSGSGATSVTVVVSRDNLASGSYTGQLQVTSNGGNQTVPVKMEVPATQVTYSFPGPGWYLISLPVIAPDNRLSVLFPSVAAAFGYNPVTGMYQTVSQLASRQGYWLLVLNASTANVAGAALTRFTQQYTVGWHLMGAV